ncbi:hypothetical protein VTP01DRAFT_4209 [Rhizomucor pusillus]|uniref:uncharacterized protein n=1 Tax=Rhizomucor pusillus TaxID=4840 RepID=UPI003744AB46
MPNESDQSTVYQEEYEVQIIDDNAEKEGSIKKGKLILQRVVLPALLLVAAGSAVAFQAGTNAAMNHIAGRSFSSFANFCTGLMLCLLGFAIDLIAFRTAPPRISNLRGAPWYSWLGGALGTYYIIINILIVPKLGAGTVLSIFVCAQVLMACVMDHFGITGIPKRKFSVWRILASLGLIGCVAVITLF